MFLDLLKNKGDLLNNKENFCFCVATSFLELWKRRQSVIVWEWDLQTADGDEEPRPEFESSVKTFRINPVTREREPYMPVWERAWRYMVTGSLVFFMVIFLNINLILIRAQLMTHLYLFTYE